MSYSSRALPQSFLERTATLRCLLFALLLFVIPALSFAASPSLASSEDESSVELRKGDDDDDEGDDNSGSGSGDDDDDEGDDSSGSGSGDDDDDEGDDSNGSGSGDDDDDVGDDNGGGNGGGSDDEGVTKAGLIKFDQRSFVASEGQGVAVITVERSKGELGAVSVEYMTQADTASAGADYDDVSGTLTWGPGDGSVRSFSIPLLDDSETEGPETVQLMLFGATGGATISAERGTAVLSIIDDESPGVGGGGGGGGGNDNSRAGVIKFDQRSFQVIESAGVASILIERSMGESGAVSVGYRTSDGSAEDGLDYSATSGTVRWPAGDGTARLVQIPILDDTIDEGIETINLELFDVKGGATLDPERRIALLEILDDDRASSSGCSASSTTLCLQGRFAVEVVWRRADGGSGKGQAVGLNPRSGLFWFFNENNIEMLFKTVDGCAAGLGAHWMFYAATTNVDFTVSVTDTRTGITKQYRNQLGAAARPVQDTETFAFCLP